MKKKKSKDELAPAVEIAPERTWASYDDDAAIIEEAKKVFAANISGDHENREAAKDDMDFLEQPWTEDALAMRTGKACLNADPLAQFRNKVKNEFAKMEPAIKVRPFDSFADVKMAGKLAGLVRHVEDVSRAKRVYCHAQGQMVDTGEGYFRVTYDFANEESFEQDIRIKRIQNRFCVVPGSFQEPDGSDMITCFVTESVPKADYEDTEAAGHEWDEGDEGAGYWHDGDNITIAEYWRIITKPDTLCLLSSGIKIFKSVLDSEDGKARLAEYNKQAEARGIPAVRVIKSRPTERPFVQCFKITSHDMLEKQEWPGSYIPIIPMIGNVLVRADGTVIRYGMVRFSKDQVRMVNYMWSEETEMVALQPKGGYVGTAEQFAGKEDQWDAMADGRSARVTYNPQVVDGVAIPAPSRIQAPQMPAAMIQSRVGAMELLKGSQGVYASGLGDTGPERSGRAILAQKSQSDTATFHYIDGPEISIQHCARVIIDLARKVITGPTMRRILGEDGKEEMQQFNSPVLDGGNKEVIGADGQPEIYDLSVGEYDVTVEMGPAYATQRQEALAALTNVLEMLPPDRQAIIADLVVGNIDAKDMDKAAARLKTMVPPEVLKGEIAEEGGAGSDPEAALATAQQDLQVCQQQIQALQAGAEQLAAALAKAEKEANDKKADNDTKKYIALLDAEVKLALADKTTKRDLLLARVKKESGRLKPVKKSEANPGDGEPAA